MAVDYENISTVDNIWKYSPAPMTLRQWYAGQALAGIVGALMQRYEAPGYLDTDAMVEAGRLALIAADALIEAEAKDAALGEED
jgi:hypothetical protein